MNSYLLHECDNFDTCPTDFLNKIKANKKQNDYFKNRFFSSARKKVSQCVGAITGKSPAYKSVIDYITVLPIPKIWFPIEIISLASETNFDTLIDEKMRLTSLLSFGKFHRVHDLFWGESTCIIEFVITVNPERFFSTKKTTTVLYTHTKKDEYSTLIWTCIGNAMLGRVFGAAQQCCALLSIFKWMGEKIWSVSVSACLTTIVWIPFFCCAHSSV